MSVKLPKLYAFDERAGNISSCFFQVPKFKALPLPYFDHVKLPEKKVKKPTQPEPFNLQVDERGAAKLQSWKQQVGWEGYNGVTRLNAAVGVVIDFRCPAWGQSRAELEHETCAMG